MKKHELSTKKLLTTEEIRVSEISTLKIFRDFCEKNNLKYYLAFGSLLGAVRHKGFIPWDDDIDVLMPRKDFDFLVNNFNNQVKENRKLISKEIDIEYAKIIDNNTILIENNEIELGVYIDIFPLDYAIEDYEKIKKINKKIIFPNLWLVADKSKVNRKRPFYKNLFIIFVHLFRFLTKKYELKREKLIQELKSDKPSKAYGFFFQNYGKLGVPLIYSSFFDETINIEFEGEEYLAPKEYDKFLTYCYGDYMKLPPKKKQVSHHNFVCFWKEGQ